MKYAFKIRKLTSQNIVNPEEFIDLEICLKRANFERNIGSQKLTIIHNFHKEIVIHVE